MADLVSASAQAIADALAPSPQAPAARWRWGSVVSVNADGTMNVSIGGATVPSIRCAQHVMGAQIGDRVRVLYCGTECMVDAVRATSATDTGWTYTVGTASDLESGNYVRWRAVGKWVTVQVMLRSSAGVSTTAKNEGIITDGYRPDAAVETAAYLGSSNDHIGTIWVDSSGNIIVAATANASSFYGSLVYPL